MTLDASAPFLLVDADPTTDLEGLAATVALSNGRLMLVSDTYTSNGDIRATVYDPASGAATASRMVNTTTFGEQDAPEAVQLANGNVVVAWTDASQTAPDFSGDTVRFQILTAGGQPVGAEITAPTSLNGSQSLISALALPDGRFMLMWQDSGRNERVFQIYNADGSASGSEQILPHGFGDSTGGSLTTHGADGLAGVGVVAGTRDYALTFQAFAAAGTPSGDPVVIVRGASFQDEHIVELAGGGFAVVWTDTSLTPPYNHGPVVRAQIITDAGVAVGGVITVSDEIFFDHNQPTVTALNDGRFAVTWAMAPDGDFLSTDVVTRIVNADGSFASEITTIYDSGTAYEGLRGGYSGARLESVSEMSDGRLVYSFRALAADGSHFLAAERIVDPRDALNVTLGDEANAFTGTRFDDRISGSGGNDTIDGGDGADTLNGGTGNDVLTGGRSAADLRDVIYGGDGNDVIDGGYGNDSLRGDAGNDTIEGGFGADTIIGGAGNDVLTGSAWSDQIFGNDGDDFINGGFGNDRLNGGAGADKFYHLGTAGHGSDWVQDYTSADNDVLVFGNGAATRAQFQVNFATTAGAGDAGIDEAFVIYRPTGQVLWALIDGAGEDHIWLQIGATTYDLLA